jgi:hypothetical protein
MPIFLEESTQGWIVLKDGGLLSRRWLVCFDGELLPAWTVNCMKKWCRKRSLQDFSRTLMIREWEIEFSSHCTTDGIPISFEALQAVGRTDYFSRPVSCSRSASLWARVELRMQKKIKNLSQASWAGYFLVTNKEAQGRTSNDMHVLTLCSNSNLKTA